MVRVDADFSPTPFKAKISNAEQLRIHTMLILRLKSENQHERQPQCPDYLPSDREDHRVATNHCLD